MISIPSVSRAPGIWSILLDLYGQSLRFGPRSAADRTSEAKLKIQGQASYPGCSTPRLLGFIGSHYWDTPSSCSVSEQLNGPGKGELRAEPFPLLVRLPPA